MKYNSQYYLAAILLFIAFTTSYANTAARRVKNCSESGGAAKKKLVY